MSNNPQDGFNRAARSFADRTVGRSLAALGVTPNQVTVLGALTCAVGCLLWGLQTNHPSLYWWGLVVFLIGALGDWFDGALARWADLRTPFGGELDSLTDRVVETAMFAALGWVLMKQHHLVLAAGCYTALGGSFLVTYTRAKAEIKGLKGDVGIGDRSTRMLVLGVFVIAGHWIGFAAAVYAINALAWTTALHRAFSIRQQLEHRQELMKPGERFAGLLAVVVAASLLMIYAGIGTPW